VTTERTTEQSGYRALSVEQTFVGIENARGQDRLAAVGIILGSLIALGGVLENLEEPKIHVGSFDIKLGFILAMLSVIVGCAAAVYVWRRYRRTD
jgi:hypothetical protein